MSTCESVCLDCFPLLTHLSITIQGGIDLATLMDACPNLTHFITNKLNWCSLQQKNNNSNSIQYMNKKIYPKMHTVGLGIGCFDELACKFILHSLTALHTIKVLACGQEHSGLLMVSSRVFEEDTTKLSSIRCLSLNDLQGGLTRGFLNKLSAWFPQLTELYASDCGYDLLFDSCSSIHFNIRNLNLQVLSLDMRRMTERRNSEELVRFCIEVHQQAGDGDLQKRKSIYYLEDGSTTAGVNNPFQRQTAAAYLRDTHKFEISNQFSSMYVNAKSLKRFHLYLPGVFTQTLSTHQHNHNTAASYAMHCT